MRVVFTDLDGTLLDAKTYSFEPALEALERLRHTATPLVIVSSKTRAELELWRRRLNHRDPFVVENGGAIFVPQGCFSAPLKDAYRCDGYEVIELGAPYERLVVALDAAADAAQCPITAFHSMTVEEVAKRCDLPLAQASLAKAREYDEAFEIMDDARAGALLAELERAGLRWTRGGRFHHVMGHSDKLRAVSALLELYKSCFSDVESIGLGDAPNDAGYLNAMNRPVIIRSEFAPQMIELVPRARVTSSEGPAGWNQAILDLVPAPA